MSVYRLAPAASSAPLSKTTSVSAFGNPGGAARPSLRFFMLSTPEVYHSQGGSSDAQSKFECQAGSSLSGTLYHILTHAAAASWSLLSSWHHIEEHQRSMLISPCFPPLPRLELSDPLSSSLPLLLLPPRVYLCSLPGLGVYFHLDVSFNSCP
ncbi:uncharacterized protein LY79DRAFT_129510 [Colletotrichum navitas]|uniref:Uncharacterized protein n=1 Tax=Colletotrichum navitas TaxID=681940 RepID=A0AAD8V7Y2_9PEZI|nr:uncharacterized protein LY79DRAFT_129510 [Colletotrichum navitas]KAK1594905.1 hypothetical protein LY79DRAFT_129510 [Colletotrichum navitas]